jgi:N-methylhydantoinase A
LRVAVQPRDFGLATLAELERDFHAAHEKRFGFAIRDEPITIVNALATAQVPGRPVPSLGLDDAHRDRAGEGSRRVWFESRWYDTPIRERRSLARGARYSGPMIIEQLDTTTVLPPWASLAVDRGGNLVIAIDQSDDA